MEDIFPAIREWVCHVRSTLVLEPGRKEGRGYYTSAKTHTGSPRRKVEYGCKEVKDARLASVVDVFECLCPRT